jgi:hypothetical protein
MRNKRVHWVWHYWGNWKNGLLLKWGQKTGYQWTMSKGEIRK